MFVWHKRSACLLCISCLTTVSGNIQLRKLLSSYSLLVLGLPWLVLGLRWLLLGMPWLLLGLPWLLDLSHRAGLRNALVLLHSQLDSRCLS